MALWPQKPSHADEIRQVCSFLSSIEMVGLKFGSHLDTLVGRIYLVPLGSTSMLSPDPLASDFSSFSPGSDQSVMQREFFIASGDTHHTLHFLFRLSLGLLGLLSGWLYYHGDLWVFEHQHD
jgi:hypothetical protein